MPSFGKASSLYAITPLPYQPLQSRIEIIAITRLYQNLDRGLPFKKLPCHLHPALLLAGLDPLLV